MVETRRVIAITKLFGDVSHQKYSEESIPDIFIISIPNEKPRP